MICLNMVPLVRRCAVWHGREAMRTERDVGRRNRSRFGFRPCWTVRAGSSQRDMAQAILLPNVVARSGRRA